MRRLVGALTCALMLGALSVATAPPAVAAENRAVVVIDTGSGSRRALISFSGVISGIQALQLAGANPATYGFAGQGAAVCSLDGVGNDPTDDACLGTPSDPRYWAYFRASGGAGSWTYSRACACATTVSDGDVEGWRFGTGQAPPFSSFCAVAGCAPAPTSPPTGGAANAEGGTGGPAPAGPTGAGTAGGSTPGGGSGGGTGGTGTGTAPDTAVGADGTTSDPTVTTQPVAPSTSTTAARRDGRQGQTLGIRPGGGDDNGAGSPWGLIVAGGLAVGVVSTAVVLRRRRSAA